jgi:prepilin-type N-terminal cleavage/methylation domain-containing protein/prepilin-type processing-associated H-X9-DG protein
MNVTKRKAFTLIELLVVIAIIAILASILFPVFARARENARRSSCLSNQKQLGLAFMQYSQDYDEKYPMMYHTPSFLLWPTIIFPYVKSTQVFDCPSNTKKWDGTAGNGDVSYGYNVWLIEQAFSNQGMAINAIGKPAETLLLVDGPGVQAVPNGSAWPYAGPLAWPNYRHLETAAVLFADGHVKAMRESNLNVKATIEDGQALTGDAQFILWNQY